MSENEKFVKARILWIMLMMSLLLAVYSYRNAKADEHIHGVTVPDWYDLDCCSKSDCHPVETKEVDFSIDKFAQPVATYKTLTYDKSRWRKSKDERYHACFRGDIVYCIYIPIGA